MKIVPETVQNLYISSVDERGGVVSLTLGGTYLLLTISLSLNELVGKCFSYSVLYSIEMNPS